MTTALEQFVATARKLAGESGLVWNPPHDQLGNIEKQYRWNLGLLAGSVSGVWFSSFAWPASILRASSSLDTNSVLCHKESIMPLAWREFCQAVLIHSVLVHRQAAHGTYRLCRMTKVLAAAAPDVSPSELASGHVQRAYNIALRIGDSEAARVFPGFVRKVIDAQHLAIRPNLSSACLAYADPTSRTAQVAVNAANGRANSKGYNKPNTILDHLLDRKDDYKLPDSRAFWELCRIVFTEEPRSLHDLQLFAACRLHIITGLRAVEIALLPLNWEHWREWTDIDGNPAGHRNGISKSLAIRHFAAKQTSKSKGTHGRQLVPHLQDVPSMFEDIVIDTLLEVENANRPLRETFEAQLSTGRLFPDLNSNELVPIWEMYPRIFGNAQVSSVPITEELKAKYRLGDQEAQIGARKRFDPSVLGEIRQQQLSALVSNDHESSHAGRGNLSSLATKYWYETRAKLTSDLFRDKYGSSFPKGQLLDWSQIFIRVGEAEAELRRKGQAKFLDVPKLSVRGDEVIQPYQLLFLTGYDKGGLRSELNLFDAEKYYAVRRFTSDEVSRALGERKRIAHLSLFGRYGKTAEDRNLHLNTHSMRHLQNTELFRKGLSDAIITKRFNRTNVQQSHVYDHRSLAEHLEAIDIDEELEGQIGLKASITYKLILSNRIDGPLVRRFRSIQAEEGDNAAFEFLAAEADGLHVTPYGFCLNSFTVDACPKHLECFNGCLHLARTDLPSEQETLQRLREQTATVVERILASPEGSLGRDNQLTHARKRLSNIDRALSSVPGERPFPDGSDLSVPIDRIVGRTLIDQSPPTSNPIPQKLDK